MLQHRRIRCTASLAGSVALLALCVGPASAARTVVRGVVHDPAGDATASVQGATAADAKRVTITYDPAGGTLEVEEKLWSPAPSFYSLKTLFAFQGCSPSSPQVLDYDTGGSAILRIAGIGIPLNVTYQRETRGTRQTETWSGPELKGLDIGCVRASVATGGPGAYGIDELADIELD